MLIHETQALRQQERTYSEGIMGALRRSARAVTQLPDAVNARVTWSIAGMMAGISTLQIAHGLGSVPGLGAKDGNVMERVVHDSGRHLGISAVLGTMAASCVLQAAEKPNRTQNAVSRVGIGLGASAVVPVVVNGLFEVTQVQSEYPAPSHSSHFSWGDVLVGGGVAGTLPILLGSAAALLISRCHAIRNKNEGHN